MLKNEIWARAGVDGFLVLCHPPVETIRNLADTGLPCIIETSAATPFKPKPNLVRIFCDTRELARTAAQHFSSRQFFKSFGYVNVPSRGGSLQTRQTFNSR